MQPEEPHKHREARFARIRRLKKWLRPLPRRSNVHRYPFLKYFAQAARNRTYLWSIRSEQVIPALYAGALITILPLQGVQIPLSFMAALLLQANLPVLIGLQFLSNAFTLPLIYAADYYLGDVILSQFYEQKNPTLSVEALTTDLENVLEKAEIHNLWGWLLDSLNSCFELLIDKGPYFFAAALLGGVLIGLIFGGALHCAYRLFMHPRAMDVAKNNKD